METYRVNPFGEFISIYLVWPVFVVKNNLPPWMLINMEHAMLELIIPSIYF
jgi:hypothetical protein